ncbi:unnamed protein product [Boreogadus saida]
MRVFRESVRKAREKPCPELDSVCELPVCPDPLLILRRLLISYALYGTSALTVVRLSPTLESQPPASSLPATGIDSSASAMSLDPFPQEDTKDGRDLVFGEGPVLGTVRHIGLPSFTLQVILGGRLPKGVLDSVSRDRDCFGKELTVGVSEQLSPSS